MTSDEGKRLIAFADFPEEQRFTFRLAPMPGRLLSAETIGGTLAQVSKVIKTSNREYMKGSKFIAVCGVRFTDDGVFEADLVELPVVKKPKWQVDREPSPNPDGASD